MKVRVQVIIESDSGEQELVEEVVSAQRDALCAENLGLTLAEAMAMLADVRRTMITAQADAYVAQQRTCLHCGASYASKGQQTIVVRTLFGTVRVSSPRFYACRCQPQSKASWSPLAAHLPERTAPQLLYLEAKFAALMSSGLTVDLLADVLPLDQELNVATVFRDVQQVAERPAQDLGEERPMFIEGCLRDWEQLPDPEGPLTVGLDGGYVHAREAPSRHEGWFEVIVGKSVPTDSPAKCFGFVQSYDTKPKRRLFEVLASQGMQANPPLAFLSDGGDTVRNLPQYLHPQAEHVLDWFHIAWTKRGAHLLLQRRTHVLNEKLRAIFCRWYPGMQIRDQPARQAA